MPGFIDRSGQRFGRLLVLGLAGRDKHTKFTYHTRCDCGTEKIIRAEDMTSGKTKSCGCLRKETSATNIITSFLGKPAYNRKDLTGRRFGKLVVEKYVRSEKTKTEWLCRCDCGGVTTVIAGNLLNNNTLSCGCAKKNGEIVRPLHKRLEARLNSHKRRDLVIQDAGTITREQLEDKLLLQKHKCAWCGKPIKGSATIDHRNPLALGGKHVIDNIDMVCLSCNCKKRSKDVIRWANENGRLL